MSQQSLTPAEMLQNIALVATKTVQDQHVTISRHAEQLGHDFAKGRAKDPNVSANTLKFAEAKAEGMTEILKIINGFRSGLYVGVKDEK